MLSTISKQLTNKELNHDFEQKKNRVKLVQNAHFCPILTPYNQNSLRLNVSA